MEDLSNNNDDVYGDDSALYTQEDLDDMYRDAFDGQPDAYWNID